MLCANVGGVWSVNHKWQWERAQAQVRHTVSITDLASGPGWSYWSDPPPVSTNQKLEFIVTTNQSEVSITSSLVQIAMTAAACRQLLGDGAGSYLHHMVWSYNQSEVSIDFVNRSEVSYYLQHLVRTCNQSEVSIM